MSCKIYCIEDINGLKYVGSTIKTLQKRLSNHKSHRKTQKNKCSSCQLDLDNCEIKLLEICDISHRFEREKYWINHIDCVNIKKMNFDKIEYDKQYGVKHRERKKEYRDKHKERKKEYDQYRSSWGGDMRTNNNLLKIDVNLFLL